MVGTALRAGLGLVNNHRRLLVPFYLANLVLALVVTLPVSALLDEYIGSSLMREALGRAMDYDVLFEFLFHEADALASMQILFLIVPALYWLVALFLSGGALVVYANDTYRPAIFWGGAAACFAPFVRLFLLCIPVFAVFFCLRFLVNLVQWVFWGSDPYEYVIYWGAWIKMGLGYLGLILYGIVFDYARIHLVLSTGRKARHSLAQALRFAARNPGRTFALAFTLFVAGWAALAVYYFVSPALSAPSQVVVIILLLLQQLYILFRLALRLTLYASQTALYRQLCSRAATPEG